MEDNHFGVTLRRFRTDHGLSLEDLGRLAFVHYTVISRVENGRRPPSDAFARAVDEALSAGGELLRLARAERAERRRHRRRHHPEHPMIDMTNPDERSLAPVIRDQMDEALAPTSTWVPSETIELMARLAGRNLSLEHRRSSGISGRVLGDALLEGVDPRLVPQHDRAAVLAANSPAHLDEIVAHLREQWHALVRTDNLLGPRFAIAGVLNHIAVIEALCAGLRGDQRLEAVRLAAQYAESAAWLYEDAGNIVQARNWTSRAMELAHEGDDDRMLAWTVFRRSQQATAALNIAEAIGLAQAALRKEERLATPTRAAVRVQEAYGHALDGNDQAAQKLLDEAHTWAASDTVGDAHQGHGSYCTPSYIEVQRANCWLATGRPKKAIMLFEQALVTLPVVYQRSRAAALSRLAVAYLADGQLEQAASAAHGALSVARTGGSMRIVDDVKAVGRELVPHRKLPEVAALLDDLGTDGDR